MLAEQASAAGVIGTRAVRPGLGEDFDSVAAWVDGEETESEEAAETVNAWIAVSAPAGGGNCQPDLVRWAHAVGGLQQEFEGEAELHFDDGEGQGDVVADGDDVAAVDFAFDVEASRLEEALDGRVEGRFGHGGRLRWRAAPGQWGAVLIVAGRWLLQDAKARFSELARRVHSEGPRHVTVHGHDEVVVLSAGEFRRLKGAQTGEALIAAMRASPFRDIDIEPARIPLPVRDVTL